MSSGSLSTIDDHVIAYRHYRNGFDAAVIIAHGFFNSKDAVLLRRLKDYLSGGFDVIMFDFRGHGESSGRFSWGAAEHADLETVLEYTEGKYGKIGLIGFSFGAAISMGVLAGNKRVASFVSVSAPSRFDKIDYHFWKLDLENDIFYNFMEGRIGKGVRPGRFWLKKINPIDVVGSVETPVFYIHGDKDWVIRHWHSLRLYEKTRATKEIRIIKNGPHAEYLLRKQKCEVLGAIRQWFEKTL